MQREEVTVDMLKVLRRLWDEDEGQGMVEYGLIIALVAVVLIGVLTLLGTNLTGLFQKTADTVKQP